MPLPPSRRKPAPELADALHGLWLMAATVSAMGPVCFLLFDGDASRIAVPFRYGIAAAGVFAVSFGWRQFTPRGRHVALWRPGGYRAAIAAALCTVFLIYSCCRVGPRAIAAGRLVDCVRSDDTATLEWTLQQGADPDGRMPNGGLSPVADGEPPLYVAAALGRMDCVKILLDHGADIECDGIPSVSPVLAAAANERDDVLQYLLDEGARANNPETGQSDALAYAVRNHDRESVRILLAHGANPNSTVTAPNGETMSVLRLADDPDIVSWLQAAGGRAK